MLDFWSDESSTDSESGEDQGGVLEPVSQSEAEVIESNQRLHRVRETHLYQRRLRELQDGLAVPTSLQSSSSASSSHDSDNEEQRRETRRQNAQRRRR